MSVYKVTSEIYTENGNFSTKSKPGYAISKFFFEFPPYLSENEKEKKEIQCDEDGDLILNRKEEGTLLIEHSISTELKLVGLQVWRGAFLLADYILSKPELFRGKTILELGSGVGLTSIVASFISKEVICTDVDYGDILKLIEGNFRRNEALVTSRFDVMELNFLNLNWSKKLQEKLDSVTVVLAADVIYDDQITDGFVKTLMKLLELEPAKTVYITLEKRYVFTVSDLESVAPMYEEFLRCIRRYKADWSIKSIDIDFPQYFRYDRVKQLILMKIEKKKN